MLRAERNASGLEVTVVAPGISEGELQTGASRTPATGSRSGSDPVAASEEEHPLHVKNSTAIRLATKTRGACAGTGRRVCIDGFAGEFTAGKSRNRRPELTRDSLGSHATPSLHTGRRRCTPVGTRESRKSGCAAKYSV